MTIRTRVAPSPTGDPHVGTAYVALANLAFANHNGGEFLLRIEDTDRARSTPESEAAILESLEWLGLHWSGTPFRQSERSALYREHVDRLLAHGDAFRCFCTPERLEEMRETQRAAKQPPHYDGHCLRLSEQAVTQNLERGVPFVVRMRVPESGTCIFDDVLRGRIEIAWRTVDMQVLLKSDGFPTYHLANVVDDHLMGVTHVIRGEEWISSAPKHVLLYRAFGWEVPQLCHLPLLRNPDKSKLSKRKNPTSILYYRERGYLAEALLHFLAILIDGRNDNMTIDGESGVGAVVAAASQSFDLHHIALGGPIFDMAKLADLNGRWIRQRTTQSFMRLLEAWGFSWPSSIPPEQREHIARVAQPRINLLTDFAPLIAFFGGMPNVARADLIPPKLTAESGAGVLRAAIAQIAGVADGAWEQAAIGEALKAAAAAEGLKFKDAARLFYVAVTGSPTSLPLFDGMEILGKVESLRRLTAALGLLEAQ